MCLVVCLATVAEEGIGVYHWIITIWDGTGTISANVEREGEKPEHQSKALTLNIRSWNEEAILAWITIALIVPHFVVEGG